MPDALHFRLRLERGTAFTLDMSESLPMRGVTAIVGPSGSGKTTLLRALAGLDRKPGDEMRVAFRGETWDDGTHPMPTEQRRIGFVFQEPNLFHHMSVEQNLRYGARRRDVSAIDAIVDALDLAPLLARGTSGLSGGEARRVALGRALAANPAVLFLDEPLSGLDLDRKSEVLPYLARAVAEAQVPALYVTHSTDEVTTLADRVLSIAAGRIAGWATPPLSLMTRAIGHDGDTVILRVEGAEDAAGEIRVPMRARLGERVRIGIPPESLMISGTHPGRTSALATLPGDVRPSEDGSEGMAIDVFGQRLRVPSRHRHLSGSRVWLSILRAAPRPEIDDSHR